MQTRKIALLAALILVFIVCAGVSCRLTAEPPHTPAQGDFTAHFIDVGQGDSILLTCGGQAMLIDAGVSQSGGKIIEYIKAQGISKLDIVAATHPHADHIGGMAEVLDAFEVGLFIMPKAEHTTVTFEKMLDAIERNGCDAGYAYDGLSYELGDADIEVLSPVEGEEQSDLNNCSLVMLVRFGSFKLMLTGDAEKKIEQRLLPDAESVDVLKVAHHGSSTSSTPDYIAKLKPKIAVICCGEGNDYGHPHRETTETLDAVDAAVYRTDLRGTIVISVNGGEIDVQTERR